MFHLVEEASTSCRSTQTNNLVLWRLDGEVVVICDFVPRQDIGLGVDDDL